MNKEQRDFITANLPELIELTTMNALVLSKVQAGLSLHKVEVDQIENLRKSEGALAASKAFYELLMTRSNSYDLIIKALDDANQSGATAVLKMIPKTASNPTTPVARYSGNKAKVIADEDGIDVYDIYDVVKNTASILSRYQTQWRDFARKLGFKTAQIQTMVKKVNNDDYNLIDMLPEMLEGWYVRLGKEATLGKLMEIARELEWINFYEKLDEKFA